MRRETRRERDRERERVNILFWYQIRAIEIRATLWPSASASIPEMALDFGEERQRSIGWGPPAIDHGKAAQQDCGSESVFSGFGSCGSGSSVFESPLGSELSSTDAGSEDDDFIAELTRQMADYMLNEEGDDDLSSNCDPPPKSEEKGIIWEHNQPSGGQRLVEDTSMSTPLETYYYSHQRLTAADQIQPLQYYQLEDQPRVGNDSGVNWGRKSKKAGLTRQPKHEDRTWQPDGKNARRSAHDYANAGIRPPGRFRPGMRAVFLGGTGPSQASCGTGVFLPGDTSNPPHRKQLGYSTVLIPTRVLQVLEQHFNSMESHSPPHGLHGHLNLNGGKSSLKQKRQTEREEPPEMGNETTELPQEWTY